MKWPWQLSDNEFVERIERCETRWRRPLAIVMVASAAICIAMAIYFYHLVDSVIFPLAAFDSMTRTSFELGIMIGFFAGKLFFLAIFSLGFGVCYYYAGRKDRLLISCFRRLNEQGELNATAQMD